MRDDEIKEENKPTEENAEKKSSQDAEIEGVAESEGGDIEYVDDELLNDMDIDHEDSDDDFKTMKESEFGEDDQQYMDGDIIAGDIL